MIPGFGYSSWSRVHQTNKKKRMKRYSAINERHESIQFDATKRTNETNNTIRYERTKRTIQFDTQQHLNAIICANFSIAHTMMWKVDKVPRCERWSVRVGTVHPRGHPCIGEVRVSPFCVSTGTHTSCLTQHFRVRHAVKSDVIHLFGFVL